MIFNLSCDLFDYLSRELDRIAQEAESVTIDIATYGISLFDEKKDYDGKNVHIESKARAFIKNISTHGDNTRLLVGLQDVRKFKNGSFGLTETQYRKKINEVLQIGKQYGIRALPTNKSHLKMYRINDLYVVGGINLTNSYWADSAVVLEHQEDKEQMQLIFNDLWRGAGTIHPLTPECVQVGADDDYWS